MQKKKTQVGLQCPYKSNDNNKTNKKLINTAQAYEKTSVCCENYTEHSGVNRLHCGKEMQTC